MRAFVTTRHGGPDAMELREVPVPQPGPGSVLVAVAAAGCNNTDLWTREGAYGTDEPGGWLGPLSFPRVQGGDVAGRVVAVGEGVDGALVGARVLVDPALYGEPGDRAAGADGVGHAADRTPETGAAGAADDAIVADVLGSERDGGFAEYVVVPSAAAHRVDSSPLSDVELGALPIAYGTALGMLQRGGVRGGATVVVTGASGGVGLAAVQLAAARGARVLAVSTAATADAVLRAGAHEVVDRSRGRVVQDLRTLAPGGVDCVVDLVAGDVVDEGLGLLRPRGRWVVAGALGGHRVSLDVRRLYLANQSLVGSTMHTPRVFRELVALARAGDIRPVVAARYPLADLPRAQRDLAGRALVGKLVIVP